MTGWAAVFSRCHFRLAQILRSMLPSGPNSGAEHPHPALRAHLPVPAHDRAVAVGSEGQCPEGLHHRAGGARAEPVRSVELGQLHQHLRARPAHAGAEACPPSHGQRSEQLHTSHRGVERRLVARVGDEVEHFLHGSADHDLALNLGHAAPPRGVRRRARSAAGFQAAVPPGLAGCRGRGQTAGSSARTTGAAAVTAGVSWSMTALEMAAMIHDPAAQGQVGEGQPWPQPGQQPGQAEPSQARHLAGGAVIWLPARLTLIPGFHRCSVRPGQFGPHPRTQVLRASWSQQHRLWVT